MSKILITGLSLALLLLSCRKKEEICPYGQAFKPHDTALFIRYRVNDTDTIFYQDGFGGNYFFRTHYTNLFINDKHLAIVENSFSFSDFGWLEPGLIRPQVFLSFFDTIHVIDPYKFRLDFFSKLIRDSYKFNRPYELSLSDTSFMVGVSLSIDYYKYSTANLYSNYRLNYDTIPNHILKDSYLSITKTEKVCTNMTMVEGRFKTILMTLRKFDETPISLSIEGNFRLLTY